MRHMFRALALLLLTLFTCVGLWRLTNATATSADSSPESEIRALIETQAGAWNRGDIDSFMTATGTPTKPHSSAPKV